MSAVEWQERAACAGAPVTLFFPSAEGNRTSAMRRIAAHYCRPCPVREQCLASTMALDPSRRYGLWGGTWWPTSSNRRPVDLLAPARRGES